MTMNERVEAARRHLGNRYDHHTMTGVLAAAFPELYGPSPTHWIAPNEPTSEMMVAGWNTERLWPVMRSAYLGETKEAGR